MISRRCEMEIVLSENKVVRSIHIYRSAFGFLRNKMPVALPLDREQVRKLLGIPYRHGDRQRNIHMGMINSWDKYLKSDYSIRFEYDEKDATVMVTIGSLLLEKYFIAKSQ